MFYRIERVAWYRIVFLESVMSVHDTLLELHITVVFLYLSEEYSKVKIFRIQRLVLFPVPLFSVLFHIQNHSRHFFCQSHFQEFPQIVKFSFSHVVIQTFWIHFERATFGYTHHRSKEGVLIHWVLSLFEETLQKHQPSRLSMCLTSFAHFSLFVMNLISLCRIWKPI